MIKRIQLDDKEIILIGTAHVSKESAELVEETIKNEKPDTVCIELCPARYKTIKNKQNWQNTDIIKVIKEKQAFLLLSNLLMSSFQRSLAKKLDIQPGQEMITAIETAEKTGSEICLADREIRVTLSRAWANMTFFQKTKLALQLVLSTGSMKDITEQDVEKLKQEDMLASVLSEIGKSQPVLKTILIDERDQFLSQKIKTAPGKKIVAVVGAGHVPGILKYLEKDIDLENLSQIPEKKKTAVIIKWCIPALIIALFISGFYLKGGDAGVSMIGWWIAANGILAGIGAIAAFAHPLTILSSVIAAPLTSLNPMIAAGWVSGMVEVFSRKPKVKDFENLAEDILSVKGFWRNKVSRVLLVVVFTNIGSSLGTFLAIPLMMKYL